MMKRILILCLAAIGFSSLNAQDVFVPINYTALEKKISKSDAEIADAKKSTDPKVWVKRGELMLSAYDIDMEQIYEGMDPIKLQLFYKDPVKKTEEFDGKTYDVYSYERINFYFLNKALAMWDRTKYVYPEPMNEAFKCFSKAIELDQAGKYSEKIHDDLEKLKNQLKKEGINSYYRNDKEGALKRFEMVLDIDKLPLLKGEVDTIMIQYAGIIARELGQIERAISHYKELAAVDNQPNTYLLIKEDYLKLGDTANAIASIEKAFTLFPDTVNIIANLVDLYIRANQIEKGLSIINAAIQNNPDKGELYYWKGRLELNMEGDDKIDNALKSYALALEKNPDLYYAYYDVGFIYYLQGQDLFTRAGDEKDIKYREEMMDLATKDYEKALPNLEKALELNNANKDIKKETLDTLKRIYYKLQRTDKYNEATEKLKNM